MGTANTSASTAEAKRIARVPQRHLRVGIAAVVVCAGAYGLMCEQNNIVSSDAVVSAYVFDLRTPVEGAVSGLPSGTGAPVHGGDVLGYVNNPRINRQPLELLQREEDDATATADAIRAEQAMLRSQQRGLLLRTDRHTRAVGERLGWQASQASRMLAMRRASLVQATTEFNRGQQLHAAGILPAADFDRLVSLQRIAKEQVAAQEADLAGLEAQVAASAHGLSSEPGATADVAYSRQRADEVGMRIAETERSLRTAHAEASAAHRSLLVETAQIDLLRQAELVAPASATIWRLNSINGEHVAAGDAILSLVDCRQSFLLVSVPQQRVPDITLHGRASFRLAGETTERGGTVLSVSGEVEEHHKLAGTPPRRNSREPMATVIVSPDNPVGETSSSREGCSIGRTARVLIPIASTNGLSRLASRLF